MPNRMHYLKTYILSALLFLPIFVTPASATTIAQLDFSDVLATAELVFEGRVVHVEAQETGPRSIHTLVRFEILDVLKGDYSSLVLELRYLGGRVGTRELEVSSMQIPELGEHGFYFVESLQSPMIHPLVGWSQGHFLIETDSFNEERVYTAEQQGVSDITTSPAPPLANAPAILGHDGSSRGVVIQGLAAPEPAITADRFRQIVRDELTAQTAAGVLP
ncbi:MAG: hypothetical protein Q8K97_00170 [Pseudohongiella sp.]|nr:hypothetical protein [Pseudohongiella sp.]